MCALRRTCTVDYVACFKNNTALCFIICYYGLVLGSSCTDPLRPGGTDVNRLRVANSGLNCDFSFNNRPLK